MPTTPTAPTTPLMTFVITCYDLPADMLRECVTAIFSLAFQPGEREVIVIDEVLTPDSSRFWPKDQYQIGCSPVSLDKQYVRDYLESLDWDKTPPAPALPEEVVAKTREKYLEALKALSGESLS